MTSENSYSTVEFEIDDHVATITLNRPDRLNCFNEVMTGEIAEIWVLADAPEPVSPCGGCRQKLAEFAGPEVMVVLAGPAGERARTTLGALLPGAFGPRQMGED